MSRVYKYFLFLFFTQTTLVSAGTDLTITNTLLTYDRDVSNHPILTFTLGWKNAWRNSKNHDAVWVFVKLTDTKGKFWHSKILAEENEILYNHNGKPGLEIKVPKDQAGLFIQPSSPYRGDVTCRVKVLLDTSILSYRGLNLRTAKVIVEGIEMVFIPFSPFYIGDTDTMAMKYASFYKVGFGGKRETYQIKSENKSISVGKAVGNLFYAASDISTHGDQSGPVPATFPKGVKAFYLMKYEMSQGEYARFLNGIDTAFIATHIIHNESGYYQNKGGIVKRGNLYKATNTNRPCNFISWDDAMAYADWSCLRPYTELEFSKACRGTAVSERTTYPWGTSSKNTLSRYINEEGDIQYDGSIDESGLTDFNLEIHGASFYWILDLAGGLWERVITIGDSTGRMFMGTHGDGVLKNGFADNADWPKGNVEKGFGFRGGGFYNHNRSYNIFNPHSPVEYRPYGSWSGPKREMAYGSRLARTADF